MKAYSARIEKLKTVAMIALCPSAYYVCHFIFANMPNFQPRLALLIAGSACALAVFVSLAYCIHQSTRRLNAVVYLCLGLAVNIGLNRSLSQPGDPLLAPLHFYALVNLALLGIAYGGGVLLSQAIGKASYLIPLALAAAMADIWSVGWGATRRIVESQTAMNYLLFSFPVAGRGVLPLIGVTDFIFAALFLAFAHRFDLPLAKTRLLLIFAFFASITIAVGCGIGVPVLPIMGVCFIIGHYQHLKMTDPREKKEALAGLLIIAATLALLTWLK